MILNALNTIINMQQRNLIVDPKKNIASEFEHQVATRVNKAMNIDELYYTINDESDNKKETEGDNDNESIIIQSTSNATFTTINRSDNNECTINWKKKEKQDIELLCKKFAGFACNRLIETKLFSALNIAN